MHRFLAESKMKITQKAANTMKIYPVGTLLMVVRSGILKRTLPLCVLTKESTINQDLKAFDIFVSSMSDYLYYVLKGLEPDILLNYTKRITTVDSLKFEEFSRQMPIPIPPLSEQHRIVARVEELMAKIDELEQIEKELNVLHKTFPGDMKAALLQAAMQGKLTDQLPEDGNARDLLAQIKEEKERLVKEKKIKKEKSLEPINEDEMPFEIPKNWVWTRLGNVISLLSGQDMDPTKYNTLEKGTIYLTGAGNIDDNGELVINRWTEEPKAIAKKGDLLISCKGTIGKTHILEVEEVHIARQFMSLRPIIIDVEYLKLFILHYVEKLRKRAKSMIPGIERSNVLLAEIPLPPLAEQHRIVEKMDKFLPLCGVLEAKQ